MRPPSIQMRRASLRPRATVRRSCGIFARSSCCNTTTRTTRVSPTSPSTARAPTCLPLRSTRRSKFGTSSRGGSSARCTGTRGASTRAPSHPTATSSPRAVSTCRPWCGAQTSARPAPRRSMPLPPHRLRRRRRGYRRRRSCRRLQRRCRRRRRRRPCPAHRLRPHRA